MFYLLLCTSAFTCFTAFFVRRLSVSFYIQFSLASGSELTKWCERRDFSERRLTAHASGIRASFYAAYSSAGSNNSRPFHGIILCLIEAVPTPSQFFLARVLAPAHQKSPAARLLIAYEFPALPVHLIMWRLCEYTSNVSLTLGAHASEG